MANQFELTKEFLTELSEAIVEGRTVYIKDVLDQIHPADIAEILDRINLDEAKFVYAQLDEEKAADVLVELEEDVREKFLESLTPKEIAEQVDNMESDDAADVIGELSEEQKEEVIAHIEDEEQKEDIVDLLTYEEDSAGGLMAKEFIKANINWPVNRCIIEMRKQAEEVDQVYTIYVVDDNDTLLGTLSLKKLLFGTPSTLIKELYNNEARHVKAEEDAEEVANIMEKYDLVVLPVVDDDEKLIGRITIDDVVDVIKEEAEKDYQMASGLAEKVESSDSVWRLSRARLPWLLIGLLGGILGAQVIQVYEADLKLNYELAYFIPLIAAMGGNVGVQSSAIVVQGLANNSLQLSSIFSRVSKEFFVAILNGIICALAIFAFNIIVNNSWDLSVTVGLSLFAVIIFAAIFGTLIPLILDKYKVDPALATGPFITTLNDILGLLIYFLIGRMMFV